MCSTLKSFVFQRWWRRTIPAGEVSVCSTWNLDIFISCFVRCQLFSDNKFFCVCVIFAKCQLCASFVILLCITLIFVQVYCSSLFTVPIMPPKEQPTCRIARTPEDGDPTPQLMPMDAMGDLVSKITQSIGDKFGEFVVSLKEKEMDVQRETRERVEQDSEERERVRKENIEMEDAIRKEALARNESLREESRNEKEENLARIE